MREARTHDTHHTGYFPYPPSTMTLIFDWVMTVVLGLFLLISVGSLCLLLGAKAGAAIADHRHTKRLAPIPIETDAERLVAQHKRINNLERTAEQPLSVWQEEDGFIGTYADNGSRIWGEGIAHPDEPEVLAPGTQYASPLITEPELVVTGAWTSSMYEPFVVSSLPGSVEIRSHAMGMKTLYELRIPIDMTPDDAHAYAHQFIAHMHERDPGSRHFDVALMYGPYVMANSWKQDDWRTAHWQHAKKKYEMAIIEAHAIPHCNILPIYSEGVAKPVAYAPYGCQCGVCGPVLGPVWERAAKALSPMFELNRAAVHEMYEQQQLRDETAKLHAENQAHLERAKQKPEPMPPKLRQVWLDHEGVA